MRGSFITNAFRANPFITSQRRAFGSRSYSGQQQQGWNYQWWSQMSARQTRRSNGKFNTWMLLAPLTVPLFMSKPEAECEEMSRADWIRGNYENKIRFFSPPEKVFEIFAHAKTEEGELEMSIADFMKCITPFNYSNYEGDAEEYLKDNKPEVLCKICDANNSGTISYTEFVFYLTLMQTPIQSFRTYFKREEPKDSINAKDFSEMLRAMRLKAFGNK